jgi:hypothetical protein
MAKKIKSLKQKLDINNTFSDSYPIGVDAENVDFKDGFTLDKKVEQLQEQINKKAVINHASDTRDYGIGTEDYYGHLKITDEYIKTVNNASSTAISQYGIVNMFNKYLLNILKVFYIEDENILFSSLNTGWQTELNKMKLISDYFTITLDTDGNYILIAKDVANQRAIDSPVEVVESELRFYSYDNAWFTQKIKIRLVPSDNVNIEMKVDKDGELKLFIDN